MLHVISLCCAAVWCSLYSRRRYSVIRITNISANVRPARCWNSDGWGGDSITLLWGTTESRWSWPVCLVTPSHWPLSLPHCPMGQEQTRLCQHFCKSRFIDYIFALLHIFTHGVLCIKGVLVKLSHRYIPALSRTLNFNFHEFSRTKLIFKTSRFWAF